MRVGKNPHQYQFLTIKELEKLNTKRLLGVLNVARALHGNLCDKGEFKDPIYLKYQKYIENIKYELKFRENLKG